MNGEKDNKPSGMQGAHGAGHTGGSGSTAPGIPGGTVSGRPGVPGGTVSGRSDGTMPGRSDGTMPGKPGRPGGPGGPGRGPFGGGHGPGGFGAPVEKPKNFRKSLKRLVQYLRPQKVNLIIVLIFAVASTVFTIAAPKIMGRAMNKMQDGFVARTVLQQMTTIQKTAVEKIKEMQGALPGSGDAGLGTTDTVLGAADAGLGTADTVLDAAGAGSGNGMAPGIGSVGMNMDPATMAAIRDFLALPMLDEVTDPSQKADICRQIIEIGKNMPGAAQIMIQGSGSAGTGEGSSIKFTQEQLDGAIRAIRETDGKIDFTYIGQIILILIGMYLISSVFSLVMGLVMSGVSQKTVRDLRREVDAKLSKLPLKYYDMHAHGDILSRMTNDIDTIATTLQQSVTQIITSVISILGYIIMMLTISPILTLILIATLPLYVVATTVIAKKSQKYFAAQQKELGDLSSHVEEMYTGHKIVKAFGHEPDSVREFGEINDRLYRVGWKAQFISGIMFPLMNFISNLGYVMICVVGGLWITRNLLGIGDIVAFIQYARSFTGPIIQTANIANIIQSTVACAERVFQVLDEAEEIPDSVDAVKLSNPKGEVSFEHVDFRYIDDTPLIEDMNLNVRQGHTIAIVGPTGAGKTTLVNLLMRFYEISAGRISVDGTDIKDMRRSDLRRMFGMVLQDTWLFNGTIKDNIAYGKKDASMDEIRRAAKAAYADHFIRTLPDGYNTILNEEATNISQGQKQLLTIARAILADPAVLILDEATSSVDTRTEVLIQRAMSELMKDRTSFVIAHRLSTIRDAELILVMNHGRIVEMGNHLQLMAKQGFYADLYNSQFAGGYPENGAETGIGNEAENEELSAS